MTQEIVLYKAEIEVASLARRIAAKLIDLLIVSACVWPILPFIVVFGIKVTGSTKVAPIVAALFYQVILCTLEHRGGGRSPGKKRLGIKIVKFSQGAALPLDRRTSLVRFGGWVADIGTFGFGIFLMLFNPQRRALHDQMAGTLVVRDKKDFAQLAD